MIKKLAIASCAALALSSTVSAQPTAGDWYLSPQFGAAIMDGSRDVNDDWGVGLGFGRWLGDNWRYGLNFQHFGTKNEVTKKNFSVRSLDAQLYYYPYDLTEKTRLVAMAGLGAWFAPGRPEMNSVSRFVDAGLGLEYRLCHKFSVQLDGRHLFSRGGGHSYDDKVVMASLNYLFPKSVKHENRQRSRLKNKLKSAGILPRMSATLFGFDSVSVSIPDEEAMADIVAYLEKYPQARLLVEGHADGKGSAQYNNKLGTRRATAFKEHLLDTSNVNESQLIVRSKGEAFPVADNDTEEGRSLNRRVEVQVIPEGIDIDSWS